MTSLRSITRHRCTVALAVAGLLLHIAALSLHAATKIVPATASAGLAADLMWLCSGARVGADAGTPTDRTPSPPFRVECPICHGAAAAAATVPCLTSDGLIQRHQHTVAFPSPTLSLAALSLPLPRSRDPPSAA